MKKQIITLTICMALTASTALAAGVSQNLPAKIKPTAQAFSQGSSVQNPPIMNREIAKQKFKEKMLQERESRYKQLGLSAEQKVKAEEIDDKIKAEAKPLVMELRSQMKKLHELKTQNASFFSIWQQKQAVKKAKKDLDKYFEKSQKDFEAILTAEQKIKYEAMEKERKAKIKEFKKEHRKHSPMDMGPPPPYGAKPPVGMPPANK